MSDVRLAKISDICLQTGEYVEKGAENDFLTKR